LLRTRAESDAGEREYRVQVIREAGAAIEAGRRVALANLDDLRRLAQVD
jgi:hypothetical protein